MIPYAAQFLRPATYLVRPNSELIRGARPLNPIKTQSLKNPLNNPGGQKQEKVFVMTLFRLFQDQGGRLTFWLIQSISLASQRRNAAGVLATILQSS